MNDVDKEYLSGLIKNNFKFNDDFDPANDLNDSFRLLEFIAKDYPCGFTIWSYFDSNNKLKYVIEIYARVITNPIKMLKTYNHNINIAICLAVAEFYDLMDK